MYLFPNYFRPLFCIVILILKGILLLSCIVSSVQSDIYKCNTKRYLDSHIRAHESASLCPQ